MNNINPNGPEYYPNSGYSNMMAPGQYPMAPFGLAPQPGPYQLPGVMPSFQTDISGQPNYYRGTSTNLPSQSQVPNYDYNSGNSGNSGQPSISTYSYHMAGSVPLPQSTYINPMPQGPISYLQHPQSTIPQTYYYQQSGYQGVGSLPSPNPIGSNSEYNVGEPGPPSLSTYQPISNTYQQSPEPSFISPKYPVSTQLPINPQQRSEGNLG